MYIYIRPDFILCAVHRLASSNCFPAVGFDHPSKAKSSCLELQNSDRTLLSSHPLQHPGLLWSANHVFFKGLGLLIELTIPGFAPETPIDPSFRREKPRYIAQTYWDNWLRDVEGNMYVFFSDIVLTKLEKLAAAKKLLFGQERNAKWLQLKHPSYLILLASEKKVRTSLFHRQNSQKSSMLSGVQVQRNCSPSSTQFQSHTAMMYHNVANPTIKYSQFYHGWVKPSPIMRIMVVYCWVSRITQ